MYRNNFIYIAGRAVPYSEVLEAEGYVDKLNLVPHNQFIDGSPYAIIKAVQFTRNQELDTIVPSNDSEEYYDKIISELLSTVYPQHIETGHVIIASKYDLVSPLLDALVIDILANILVADKQQYSDALIFSMIAPYAHLIKVDPSLMNHELEYVEIHPRWDREIASLSTTQYTFISRVNELVLKNQVLGLPKYFTII
jgi:hypothetical protein